MAKKEGEKTFDTDVTEEMWKRLNNVKNNPGAIIEWTYDNLKTLTDGNINVPDVTNPFSYLMESAAMMAATLHDAHEATYRKQYPRLATTYSDLYNHMFDEHYIGRFASPGRVKFDIAFRRDELIKNLAETDIRGVKRIIIPRGSVINAGDYMFTLLYSITITQLPHGSMQVLYRTDELDPVQPLSSNVIDWGWIVADNTEYLRLSPVLLNVKVETLTDALTQVDGYRNSWPIRNKFCHCRVYQKDQNGIVTELATTHSDVVHDPEQITARLIYLEDKLTVIIPPIYFNKGLLNSTLIVEVYTTMGDVEEPLNELPMGSFSYQWDKLKNYYDDSKYVAPLELLSKPRVYATGILTGGTNGESFEKTRDRVVNNAAYVKNPITRNQLETSLQVNGYDVIKSRDTLTSRGYLAVKPMPTNKLDGFNAGAAAAMETIRVSIEELVQHPEVRDNGKRITITPDILFKQENGLVSIVYPEKVPSEAKLGMDRFIEEINTLNYSFTPFYYVLDTNNSSFNMRAYYFNNPVMKNQIFVASNETALHAVTSDEIFVRKYRDSSGEGFKIYVLTRSTEGYTKTDPAKRFCQMMVKPYKDTSYAAVNGKLIGQLPFPEEKTEGDIWEFTIKTNWDVTENNTLVVHDFYMHINEPRRYEIDLETDLHFIYGLLDEPEYEYRPNEVDKMVNRQIINSDNVVAITHDKITCRFGYALDHFWVNAIPVQSEIKYRKHKHDVPRVYTSDVFEVTAEGNFVLNDNELVPLHRAGDPVLDEHGNQLMLHRKGDVMIDGRGMPIVEENRKTIRLLDILMIDGIYYFATDENDIKYRDSIGNTLKDYITQDLDDIANRLLENTSLYFYPKRTMGSAKVVINAGKETQIPMRQSFSITYYLKEVSYLNMDLRKSIVEMTHKEINNALSEVTVTTSDIISTLREKAGEDVVAVTMNGLGPNGDITAYTTTDLSVRCSVKRVIKMQADRRLKVFEDIDVNFLKHDTIEETKA
nr:MAG TPA: Putative virion structural protein 2 [Caudoviricetes sp.]